MTPITGILAEYLRFGRLAPCRVAHVSKLSTANAWSPCSRIAVANLGGIVFGNERQALAPAAMTCSLQRTKNGCRAVWPPVRNHISGTGEFVPFTIGGG